MRKQLIDTTPSTNTLLEQMITDNRLNSHTQENNLFTLYTYNQTAGRGQRGNHWESEPYKNLTFSTLFQLTDIPVGQQFMLSELVPIAITNVLNRLLHRDRQLTIKWPNDIYWCNKKLCGILIEHSIIDGKIDHSIAGVGININQTIFLSDAPNPVSLKQITGQEYDLDLLMDSIINEFNTMLPLLGKPDTLKSEYMDILYRRNGYFPYISEGRQFEARIVDVAHNGIITLETREGSRHEFAFKQISYVI